MSRTFDSGKISGEGGIVLEPIGPLHAQGCFEACQDEEIHRWLPLPRPYTRELAEEWCQSGAEMYRRSGQGIHYAILDSGAFAGCISVKNVRCREGILEVGYWVAPHARGTGVATRAVRALSLSAFANGFERVELRIAPLNERSIAVAERTGFTLEGQLRSAGITHDGRVDLLVFSLLMTDVFH